MPYRRRRNATRNPRRRPYVAGRRRYAVRRSRYSRRPRRFYKQTTTYKFKRMFHAVDRTDLPDVVQFNETTGGLAVSLNFTLQDVPNYTEFTALYDEYKITGVVVECIPTFTGNELNVAYAGTLGLSSIYSAIDFNGQFGASPSLATIGQQNGVRHTRMHKTHRRYLRPKPLNTIYREGVTSAYASQRNAGWISTQYVDVQHYGLNMLIEQIAATGAAWAYRFTYTYYLQFRGTK